MTLAFFVGEKRASDGEGTGLKNVRSALEDDSSSNETKEDKARRQNKV